MGNDSLYDPGMILNVTVHLASSADDVGLRVVINVTFMLNERAAASSASEYVGRQTLPATADIYNCGLVMPHGQKRCPHIGSDYGFSIRQTSCRDVKETYVHIACCRPKQIYISTLSEFNIFQILRTRRYAEKIFVQRHQDAAGSPFRSQKSFRVH